ncbi:isoprenyl transferase [candidate division KSB1 bacterium]|nr:MAG: isoprenyl transferase [candidate division KSB1 bacterium]
MPLTAENPQQRLDIPRHVAVIMDGNGRWAKARGLSRIEGHKEGVKSTHEIVEVSGELGVEVLTLYTFSSENWKRPRSEVEALMELLVTTIGKETTSLMRNNVRLRAMGRIRDLTPAARAALSLVMRKTAKNNGLILNLALSYGSRQEITDAMSAIIRSGKKRITEDDIEEHLYTAGLPDPDLLIRTSGELRLSNFMLWQMAYTEIVVTETLWPDFRKPQYVAAIEEYNRRHRRFGGIEEGS